MSDLTQVQTEIEEAWGEHDTARSPMRDELLKLVDGLRGVTGLDPGPGAERLVDAFLDFGEYHATDLSDARSARGRAMRAQDARDEITAALPPPEPPALPAELDNAEPARVREWLTTANDADVRRLLSEVQDVDAQREWAQRFQTWGRADGAMAQVFVAINQFLPKENPAEVPDVPPSGGVGATTTYPASPDVTGEVTEFTGFTGTVGVTGEVSVPADIDADSADIDPDPYPQSMGGGDEAAATLDTRTGEIETPTND